jgi:predicted PurR-regulated permease PerM
MILDKQPYTLDRIVRIGIVVALAWGGVWLLKILSDVLIPFAAALLLAYLINPFVKRLQRKIRRRGMAVFLALLILGLAAIAVLTVLIPLIVTQVVDMGRIVSALVTNSDLAEKVSKRLPPNLWEEIKEYISRPEVQQFFQTENFFTTAKAVLQRVLPGVWGVITGTASIIIGFVGLAVIGLYLVFLLMDYGLVKERWKAMVPAQYRTPVVEFVGSFGDAMNSYFRGQASVAGIVGVVYAVGFFVIGLPMGIVLGLFIGLLNMVPYLQVIGLVPAYCFALIHALDTGRSVWLNMGLVTVVVVVAEVLQSAVLVPRIMGKATGLRPVIMLLSLSIWGKLLGFFGLLIALPMTCLLLAYYARFLASNTKSS